VTGIGKTLLVVAAALGLLGLGLLALGRLGFERNFFGRLPGDLHFRTSRGTFYFPLGTCLVVSVVLSLLSWLLRKGE